VFMVVDHFSKLTLLKGMREATSAGVIRCRRCLTSLGFRICYIPTTGNNLFPSSSRNF